MGESGDEFVDEKPGGDGQGKGDALQPLLKPCSFGMDGRSIRLEPRLLFYKRPPF
jgi:hypothetical protein